MSVCSHWHRTVCNLWVERGGVGPSYYLMALAFEWLAVQSKNTVQGWASRYQHARNRGLVTGQGMHKHSFPERSPHLQRPGRHGQRALRPWPQPSNAQHSLTFSSVIKKKNSVLSQVATYQNGIKTPNMLKHFIQLQFLEGEWSEEREGFLRRKTERPRIPHWLCHVGQAG